MAKLTDPDARVVAATAYQTQREAFHAAARLQGQYGTWLIATGTATQAAAIYLTTNLPSDFASAAARASSIAIFGVGLLLMFLCGLASYLNCNLHMALYARWSDASILVDSDHWPTPAPRLLYRIDLSYGLALEFGILGVLCLPIGGVLLLNQIVIP